MRSYAIHINDLTFCYPQQETQTLNIQDWRVKHGEHFFLYGPSGSGKSTLLNILTGILVPQRGTVTLFGQSMSELSISQRDRFRAKHVGVIFQQFNLIPYLSVSDNLRAAHFFADGEATSFLHRQEMLLGRLGLTGSILKRKAGELSVGQQQRVAIGRALINSPKLIIADEPTSALDNHARDNFMHLLLETIGDATLLFVSHDRSLQPHFSSVMNIKDMNGASELC